MSKNKQDFAQPEEHKIDKSESSYSAPKGTFEYVELSGREGRDAAFQILKGLQEDLKKTKQT